MFTKTTVLSFLLLAATEVSAFQPASMNVQQSTTSLSMTLDSNADSRRSFLTRSTAAVLAGFGTTLATAPVEKSNAVVYLDPAMYGDQETRLSAVDSAKEGVRRAILQKPTLAPAFYTLALLDGLSYNLKSGEYGPDGRIVPELLALKDPTPYLANLKEAAEVIVASKKSLKKLTSITIADAVALGGTASVEAIGGPNLSIQVGRTDSPPGSRFNPAVPLNLFEGVYSNKEISDQFKKSGLTEREMTALMGALLTLESVEKSDASNWSNTGREAFRERGKIGRMSEYKKLTDEDIAAAAAAEFEDDDDEPGLFDDQPYIADTFGTRDQAFGKKTGDLDPKNFNKYLQAVNKSFKSGKDESLGWIGKLLTDKDLPGTQTWVSKYAQSNLNYQKDLGIAFNSMSQLGGEFTGGKYENLLKNKPRKRLNDFD